MIIVRSVSLWIVFVIYRIQISENNSKIKRIALYYALIMIGLDYECILSLLISVLTGIFFKQFKNYLVN